MSMSILDRVQIKYLLDISTSNVETLKIYIFRFSEIILYHPKNCAMEDDLYYLFTHRSDRNDSYLFESFGQKPEITTNAEKKAIFKEAKNYIKEKYTKLHGKQLFLRFPKNLPDTKDGFEEYIKKFNERIIDVHRPRQKRVSYCFVHFDNESERNKALIELNKVEVDGGKLQASIPVTENAGYLKKLSNTHAAIRTKHAEKRKKKELNKALYGQKTAPRDLSLKIFVSNIPPNLTAVDLKALFPRAAEINLAVPKEVGGTSFANITFPSKFDASLVKQIEHKVGDNILKIIPAEEVKSAIDAKFKK